MLIGGTGRAGTTLLVQLFSALGLDTGFSAAEAKREVDPHSHAGLERWLADEDRPYIIKNPRLSDELGEALDAGRVTIDAAIIPVRDLFSAAESRRSVFREAGRRGGNALGHPGSLWKTSKPHKQEEKLAVEFFRFLHTLVRYEVTTYFLEFPRFARDPEYFARALGPFLASQGVSSEDAVRAVRSVANPALISEFAPPAPGAKRRAWWFARRS